jgi:hypothetical protein
VAVDAGSVVVVINYNSKTFEVVVNNNNKKDVVSQTT